jgi:hypothetical protein
MNTTEKQEIVERARRLLKQLDKRFAVKHDGPGPHDNGSSQDAHAGGGMSGKQIKKGSIVRFKFPDGKDEEKLKMRVLEDRGDRVLVEAMNGMAILPTFVYRKDDLIADGK